jgi:hypothetical protein
MKTCHFYSFLFVVGILGACKEKVPPDALMDKNDMKLTVQYGGLIPIENLIVKDNAYRVSAAKYGVKYQMVNACTSTDSIEKAKKKHNDAVDEILKVRFGDNWKTNLENEFKVELGKEQDIIQILKNDSIISDLLKDKRVNRFLEYHMDPIPNTNTYFVSIDGTMKVSPQHSKNVSFKKLIVDYKTRKIIPINDTIQYIAE